MNEKLVPGGKVIRLTKVEIQASAAVDVGVKDNLCLKNITLMSLKGGQNCCK